MEHLRITSDHQVQPHSVFNKLDRASGMSSLPVVSDAHILPVSEPPSSQILQSQPVLAVLVSSTVKTEPPFGEMNLFFQEVIYFAERRRMMAYIVTLQDLAPLSLPILGWTYHNGKWHRRYFPVPDVVYNRIPSRKIERSSMYQRLKQELEERNIPLFNQTFLNKWTVHHHLSKVDQLKPFLPETHRFDGKASLAMMLSKYPTVFLKPVHGSLGRGIYKIKRLRTGFTSEYSTLNGEIVKSFPRFKTLVIYLSKRINKHHYMIQEGIPILHVEGRPVDFRALMQKNGQGQWSVTSMVARIGSANRFVSNISRGGEVAKVLETLRKCQIPQVKETRRNLTALAKRVCQVIDQTQDGHFGELGVDLALTHTGRIYILEVNSKPSKTDNTLPDKGLKSKGRPSVHRLLDYTLFLIMSKK
ncbi:glutathione synthase/RimK-type ligase-like ATP-grasp enzyme [Caldalkalibacillus uzonensis]|uniref:Glutathione synthase/RimK-type ligase-like ATP-grasp enzyme n=1 Tax=Caldalkalibacillus uzonensis TaxID=353224 RepID=A0ABU0CRE4_9BACI|nr:YheC/YheD family protein [Caldalkalibacillus uzonensis]MDQ0338070.1 glutathione synthase/RimK-type ligase-like ATP-grasp enzyme [Caldalkalibacillus uzonensis]